VKDTKSLANQRLHINVKSLCSSEVWVDAVFVQNYLGDTFFNQLVIQRPATHNWTLWHSTNHITLGVLYTNYKLAQTSILYCSFNTTTSSQSPCFAVQFTQTEYATFCVSVPTVWNSLPTSLWLYDNVASFKWQLETKFSFKTQLL